MKFRLFEQSTVRLRGRDEERYHYESEDKSIRIIFNAGEEPWSWEVIGNGSQFLANKLIGEFVHIGLGLTCGPDENREEAFKNAIKELEVDYHQ